MPSTMPNDHRVHRSRSSESDHSKRESWGVIVKRAKTSEQPPYLLQLHLTANDLDERNGRLKLDDLSTVYSALRFHRRSSATKSKSQESCRREIALLF